MDESNSLSTELAEANNKNITTWVANPYLQAATSLNTRKAYRHDIRHYENWGGRLPASPEHIVRYLEAFAPVLNPRTLSRRLIALRHWHTYQGFADPTLHPAISKTMTGILRIHGKPKDKARALTVEEMQQLASYLEKTGTLAGARDNALLQTGFFGALRRSELAAICLEHIAWKKDGIEIMLPSSKTDQIHEGQYSNIPRGNHELCPIRAIENWLEMSAINTGPVFRRITPGEHIGNYALTPLSVNHILKQRASEAGLTNLEALSSHSLRRGLATSAAKSGAPLHTIMRAGRWKHTNTVMEYIEESDRFMNNAASMVLSTVKSASDADITTNIVIHSKNNK
jgi:site-specific recombinase XerD